MMATDRNQASVGVYLRIGAWNMRSVRNKEEELVEEMKTEVLITKTFLVLVKCICEAAVRRKLVKQRWYLQA